MQRAVSPVWRTAGKRGNREAAPSMSLPGYDFIEFIERDQFDLLVGMMRLKASQQLDYYNNISLLRKFGYNRE